MYHHIAACLTASPRPGSSRPHITQISAGWQISACLTSSGMIHTWLPFSDAYQADLTEGPSLPMAMSAAHFPRKTRMGTVGEVVHTLEPIPPRPEWRHDAASEAGPKPAARTRMSREELEAEWREWEATRTQKTLEADQKVVQIASGQDFVVALKANGEVWFHRVYENQLERWIYVRLMGLFKA